MKKIIYIFVLVIIAFSSCEDNEFDNNLSLFENKMQVDAENALEDTILFFEPDTTSYLYKSMKKLKLQNRHKVASSTTDYYDALNMLFDLRDFPINIIVKENTNGSRFLTAMRKKKTFLWVTSYSSLPSCFAQKQNDGNTTSQTFYLNYIPLVGDYYLTTKNLEVQLM